jgi:hypothetical protein
MLPPLTQPTGKSDRLGPLPQTANLRDAVGPKLCRGGQTPIWDGSELGGRRGLRLRRSEILEFRKGVRGERCIVVPASWERKHANFNSARLTQCAQFVFSRKELGMCFDAIADE